MDFEHGQVTCEYCDGFGMVCDFSNTDAICPTCKGTGSITPTPDPDIPEEVERKDGRPSCGWCGRWVPESGKCCDKRNEEALRACATLADPERDMVELVMLVRDMAEGTVTCSTIDGCRHPTCDRVRRARGLLTGWGII